MAHSRTEQGTKVIHLVLNEQEASFLRDLTQNPIIINDLYSNDSNAREPVVERRARISIFEELNNALR